MQATRDLAMVCQTLQQHGFSLNLEKTQLRPTTRILYLGAVIDSARSQFLLSPDRCLSIRTPSNTDSLQSVPLILLSQLLRKMILCIAIILWALFHAQPLQWYLLPYQKSCRSNSRAKVLLPATVCLSFRWWTSTAVEKGCIFQEPQSITVTTDASLLGWGTHLLFRVPQRCWSLADLQNDIN